jgi:hypothetical protein
MSSRDIRDILAVTILAVAASTLRTISAGDPYNDFAMYYDEAIGVDRSPSSPTEAHSVWLYTPLAKVLFRETLGHFRYYQDAHTFWASLNMAAIFFTVFIVARMGWYGLILCLPVLPLAQELWTGGNMAPLLTALSLTPIGSAVACLFKPYFFLFTLILVFPHWKNPSSLAVLIAASVFASYSVLGLTTLQREWIQNMRLFSIDYWYVIAIFVAVVIHTHGEKFISVLARRSSQ